MFYKVIKDGKVIDVLNRLIYLKYQKKHDRMIFCNIEEAQAILSSDEKYIWHTKGLYKIPVDGYDEVELVEIDEYEYRQLKALNGKTPEEIIDGFVLGVLNSDMNQFIESLKRLYDAQAIKEDKIVEMCNDKKINEEEKKYILEK